MYIPYDEVKEKKQVTQTKETGKRAFRVFVSKAKNKFHWWLIVGRKIPRENPFPFSFSILHRINFFRFFKEQSKNILHKRKTLEYQFYFCVEFKSHDVQFLNVFIYDLLKNIWKATSKLCWHPQLELALTVEGPECVRVLHLNSEGRNKLCCLRIHRMIRLIKVTNTSDDLAVWSTVKMTKENPRDVEEKLQSHEKRRKEMIEMKHQQPLGNYSLGILFDSDRDVTLTTLFTHLINDN